MRDPVYNYSEHLFYETLRTTSEHLFHETLRTTSEHLFHERPCAQLVNIYYK